MNKFRFEYSCSYYVCTWYTHVCTWYVIVCSVWYLKNVIPFPAPGNFHCELACNPFMIGLDSAYRQELAIRYILGTYLVYNSLYLSRMAVSIWSAFLWLFFQNTFKRVCQRLNSVERCWVMYGHEKGKMAQESWPYDKAILSEYRQW